MLIVNETAGSKVQATLSVAVAVDVHASLVAMTRATGNYSDSIPQNTNITTTATTTVVSAPSAGISYGTEFLSFANKDASLSTTITVDHVIGSGITARLVAISVPAGMTLQNTDEGGWSLTPTAPALRTIKTIASGTTDTITGPLLSDLVILWQSATGGAKTETIPAGTGSFKTITIVDGQGTADTDAITASPAAGSIVGSASGTGKIIDEYGHLVLFDYAVNTWVQTG